MKKNSSQEKIDFVLTWVDPSDREWQRKKAEYQGKTFSPEDAVRYRDWDNLKYWFRGVEKFAPWVNSIYFVTCGQIPEWLNTGNPKLRTVNHTDYIPSGYLPTFSSNAIDLNFHRIPSLSEHFVRFDDDMFLLSPVRKEDFFVNGFPRGIGGTNINEVQGRFSDGGRIPLDRLFMTACTDVALINRNFEKNRVIFKNPWKWFSPVYGKMALKTLLLLPFKGFSGFADYHLPYPYLKSEFEAVWKTEGEALDEVCSHRFRVNTDANHWLIYYWQLCEGKFVPQSPKVGKYFVISEKAKDEILLSIRKGSCKMICINDCSDKIDFEEMKASINDAFEYLLPDKCSFEK